MSVTASASPILPYIGESSFAEQILIQQHNTSIRFLGGKFQGEEEQEQWRKVYQILGGGM